MISWKTASIKIKLLVAAVVAGVITLTVGVIGWTSVNAVSNDLTLVAQIQNASRRFVQLEVDHLEWVQGASEFFRDTERTALGVQIDHRRCGLGEWYFGEERATMEQIIPELKEPLSRLDGPHRKLHQSASEIETILSRGQAHRQEAYDYFEKVTMTNLRDVQATLEELVTAANRRAESVRSDAESAAAGARLIMIVFMITGTVASILISSIIAGLIASPIRAMVGMLKDIAQGEGDLTVRLKAKTEDELGEMAKWFNMFIGNIQKMIRDISGNAQTLASASTELSAVANQMTAGSKDTLTSTSTVAAAAEEMSANSASVASGMEHASGGLSSVATATEEMSATVGEIASNAEKARTVSSDAAKQAEDVTNMMKVLGNAAQEIGAVTETITSISAQTNLLALNATIEAARAGAAGKGFAVVASEIKALAEQTAQATGDIKEKISAIQSSTGTAVTDIDKISGVIREVGEIIYTIATAIEEQATVTRDIAGNISEASSNVKEANERVAQTAEVSQSIAKDISSVNKSAEEMSGSSEQVNISSEELSKLAEQLKSMVGKFKV